MVLILWQLLIEVDQLHNIPTPYIQIKGSNKETVADAGLALNLDGSYTTMVRNFSYVSCNFKYFSPCASETSWTLNL